MSTVGTAKSAYQKSLIEKFAKDIKVLNVGTDKLVPLIEKGENVDDVLEKELEPFINQVDVLALGCTHFPLIKDKIQKILGSKVLVLDSGPAIARQVKRVLSKNRNLSKDGEAKREFYTTGNEELFNKILNKSLYNGKAERVTL